MAWPPQRRQPSTGDGWVALGWSLGALLAAGVLATLASPGTTPEPYTLFAPRDFIRPEWLVLATFIAFPLFLASRERWWVAIPVFTLLSAESWYVVDSAVGSLHQVGLTSPGRDIALYVLLGCQVAVFAAAAWVGARQSLVRRRWLRQMRRVVPDLAQFDAPNDPARPAWSEGFFSTG
jgi:hypothetical protein